MKFRIKRKYHKDPYPRVEIEIIDENGKTTCKIYPGNWDVDIHPPKEKEEE